MNLIQLTEIMKDGAGTKRQPILINPEIIATITTGQLEKKTVPIIGEPEAERVTFIEYRNGRGTFVEETLEDIMLLFNLVGKIPAEN